MIVAILNDDATVTIGDRTISGPTPENWIAPCPAEFETADVEFLTHDEGHIIWKPQEEIDAIIAAREVARQDAKSAPLKTIETAYCNFLEGAWTLLLRSKGMVAPDASITVENTNTEQNTAYLLTLMQADMTSYTPMSAVFLGFKTAIEGMGGTMADCRKHI